MEINRNSLNKFLQVEFIPNQNLKSKADKYLNDTDFMLNNRKATRENMKKNKILQKLIK
jgi:hypothetical protein